MILKLLLMFDLLFHMHGYDYNIGWLPVEVILWCFWYSDRNIVIVLLWYLPLKVVRIISIAPMKPLASWTSMHTHVYVGVHEHVHVMYIMS